MKQLLIVICGVMLWACGGAPGGAAAGAGEPTGEAVAARVPSMTLVLSDSLFKAGSFSDTIDMGRIHAGEVVRYDLLLRNDDPKPFVILSVKTSCGCTTVDFAKEPVQPGQSVPLSFQFDSKGFKGYQMKHISIATSLSSVPFVLVATGEVVGGE